MCTEALRKKTPLFIGPGEDCFQFSLERSMDVINLSQGEGYTISLHIDCNHSSRERIKTIVAGYKRTQIIELPSGEIDHAVNSQH